MKKFLLAALLCPVFCPAFADDGFTPQFRAALSENRVVMEYRCTTSTDERRLETCGTVTFQDGAFVLESSDFKVYDDGETSWTIFKESREVVGSRSAAVHPSSNPSSIIGLFGFDGRNSTLDIVSDEDGTPLKVDVRLMNGMKVTVDIVSVRLHEKGDAEDFSFDPDTLDSSYMVTDLR